MVGGVEGEIYSLLGISRSSNLTENSLAISASKLDSFGDDLMNISVMIIHVVHIVITFMFLWFMMLFFL